MESSFSVGQTYDIAVIGGGIAGAATAWHAQRSGATVAWYTGCVGNDAATWVSGGMLAPKAEGLTGPALEQGQRALAVHDAFVTEVEAAAGVSVHRGRGMWLPVCEGDPADWLLRYAAARRDEGADVRIDDRASWPTTLPAPPLHGAIAYPDEGWVDPRGMWTALRTVLQNTPGVAVVNEAATALERSGDIGIRSACGLRKAASVVVAAGYRSAAIAGIEWSRVGPIWGDRGLMVRITGVAPPPGVLYRHAASGITYVVPDPCGIRLGSTSDPHDTRPLAAVGELSALLTRGAALWPPLATGHIAEVSVGWRPCGPRNDALPFVAPLDNDPRVWGLLGLDRNGILLAPLLAAEVVAGVATVCTQMPRNQY